MTRITYIGDNMLIPQIEESIKESGLKKIYIAAQLGISRETLRNWCRGISYPSAPELFKLARILNKKIEDLYIYKEEE